MQNHSVILKSALSDVTKGTLTPASRVRVRVLGILSPSYVVSRWLNQLFAGHPEDPTEFLRFSSLFLLLKI